MKLLAKLAARERDCVQNGPVVVACLGDSVTHGCFEVFVNEKGNIDTRCDADAAYPARLGRALGALYPFAQPTILNAGVSGDNACGGLDRLERDVLRHAPDLVIVNFALNDSMHPDVEAGLARYKEAMGEIFRRVLASGAECLLLTPSPMCEYASHALPEGLLRDIAENAARVQTGGVLDRYVEAARGEARALNVPIADAYRRWDALRAAGVNTTALLSNHINHPTAGMHEVFVEAILSRLLDD